MRTLKFRLRAQNKIVGYEKWYEGKWSEELGYWLAKPCWLYSTNDDYWNPEQIYNELKDAWTGLLDKNGKEIYEGDVVKIGEYVDEIVFSDGMFVGKRIIFTRDDKNQRIEIIGNIYSNPELIKP